MAFTEFCCRSGGSNLNAGSRTGSSTEPGTAADLTYASGNWVQSTGVFTAASGDPVADGVAVGDFASVYADGSSVTGFVGRVTARDTTTITVSLTVKSGTAPTDGTADRTLKIGGAWAGPSGATIFPTNFISGMMVNVAGNKVRLNYKNDQTYSISVSLSHAEDGLTVQGYSSSYGDRSRAVIDGGSTGSSFTLYSITRQTHLHDLELKNNGNSGALHGLHINSSASISLVCSNIVCRDLRGIGIYVQSGRCTLYECEAYNCNQSNTSNWGGIANNAATPLVCIWCISHDNTQHGYMNFTSSTYLTLISCIADSNSSKGVHIAGTCNLIVVSCDFYNNGSHGIDVSAANILSVENSNFIKNGGYGVIGSAILFGVLENCGFGAGTQANTSGQTSAIPSVFERGSITYPADVTPWVDPADGDFRINLAEAKGAGRGAFTQTQSGYGDPTPTVGYPDIGSAQHEDAGGTVNNIIVNRPRTVSGPISHRTSRPIVLTPTVQVDVPVLIPSIHRSYHSYYIPQVRLRTVAVSVPTPGPTIPIPQKARQIYIPQNRTRDRIVPIPQTVNVVNQTVILTSQRVVR